MSKKSIIGILLILIGIIGFFETIINIEIGPAIVSVIICIIGGYLFSVGNVQQQNTSTSPEATDSVADINKNKSIPDGEKDYDLFFDVLDDSALSYQYEKEICSLDYDLSCVSGNGGKPISFVQEPENEYDDRAVAIYLNDNKLGYVYRGTTQDMINDWIKRNWQVVAYINKFNISERKVTYKIGFYKPLDLFDSKEFSVVKTGKKDCDHTPRYENLETCNVGDTVDVDYDYSSESYVLTNYTVSEIGELPASASSFINAANCKSVVGVISEMTEDDNGKPKAKVKIYLIK